MAQQVCVVCGEPSAVYVCSIEKSEKIAKFGAWADKAIDQVCAREMARSGKHAKCNVRRDLEGAACAGIRKQITLDTLLDAAAAATAPKTATAPPAQPAPPPPEAGQSPSGPPRTLQEMAERGAGANAWNCLASFFTKC